MSKYKLLDLYCCGGSASKGYADAGFEVTGVDIEYHPNYPFDFVERNALDVLKDEWFIRQFDVIVASPPCQRYSKLKYLSGDLAHWDATHPDLIPETRRLLELTGKPYVIENVEGAPLIDPIKLCGSQFDNMFTQRPRLFESNVKLVEPERKRVKHQTPLLGNIGEDGWVTVAGTSPLKGLTETQTKLYYGIALGGVDWLDLDELTQAVPPCYTEFIGKQLIAYLEGREPYIPYAPKPKQKPKQQKRIERVDFLAEFRKKYR